MRFQPTYIVFMVVAVLATIACGKTTSTPQNIPPIIDSTRTGNNQEDSMIANKRIEVYKFDSTYKDSNQVDELWYLNDSLVKQRGNFYYPLPFESDFFTNDVIHEAAGKAIYETFDSLVCEVGGKSAWNKYFIKYNKNQQPTEVKHFKAWWNEGLGEGERPAKPKYFLSETIQFKYLNKTVIQKAYDESGQLIETIQRNYDDNRRLLFESWDAWNTYRYKTYYYYN